MAEVKARVRVIQAFYFVVLSTSQIDNYKEK